MLEIISVVKIKHFFGGGGGGVVINLCLSNKPAKVWSKLIKLSKSRRSIVIYLEWIK